MIEEGIMSVVANQPENLNLLSPVAFRFNIKDVPNVSFFCQTAQIPGVSLGEAAMQTPLATLYKAGDVTYDPLAIRFIVDEDMKNYFEIYEWIKGLGHPTDFQEYRDFRSGSSTLPRTTGFGATQTSTDTFTDTSQRKSDATLTVLTNKLNGNIQVNFKDCFPISLSAIDFDLTNADISSIVIDTTFRYTHFDIVTTI